MPKMEELRQLVFDHLDKKGNATVAEIATALGVTNREVYLAIRYLQEAGLAWPDTKWAVK